MLRLKLTLLVLIIGVASSMASDPVIQLINLSPDPAMSAVKVEYGDSVIVDSLVYNDATAYLSVPAAMGTSLTFTSLSDELESLELNGLDLADGDVVQSILYGVIDTNDYAQNPDGNDRELNATWDAVDTSGIASGDIRVNFFHAVGDAVEMDVADFLFEYIVDNMSFGQYSSQSTDLPAVVRNLFFVSTDSVTQIASRSADLSVVSGNTVTIFISGFIVPGNNNNGPVLSFSVVEIDGTVTEMGFVLAIFQDELFAEVNVYPNPATDLVQIDLDASSPMQIELALIDLAGREFMNSQYQLMSGSNNLRLNLPELSHGMYFVRLSNDNGQAVLPIMIQ